jgi:acetyltransferase-like isoleucine patch superfamily enzyme
LFEMPPEDRSAEIIVMQVVYLPALDANMTEAVVRAWLKEEGQGVRAGEPLFEVETDKANIEVEAEASGTLRRIVAREGTKVPVLGVVAFIGAADEPIPDPEQWEALVPKASASIYDAPVSASQTKVGAAPGSWATAAGKRVAASPAARRLAAEHGIALEAITASGSRGEVTRADVDDAIRRGPATTAAPREAGTAAAGTVDPAFVAMLRRDPGAFRSMSSESKVALYRQNGAAIGERVRIEPGALVIADEINIGAAASIGADSTIDCKRFVLGRLSGLGERTRARCRSISIGDALWAKDDVVIGGGGSGQAQASLMVGDACFFGEGSYLNAGEPLVLGDEVCIGSRAMLFTHSHWQSVLRGYASRFGPIEVQDHVFIGNNVFVFPGITIGADSTVMVNSFVAVNVPPRSFVGGVPAQVVRHIEEPSRERQVEIVRAQLPELVQTLRESGRDVSERNEGDVAILGLGTGESIRFVPEWNAAAISGADRTVVLTFAEEEISTVTPPTTVFDLNGSRVHGKQDALSDEVREFCRRRGIRFRPFAWRYGVGHFEDEVFYPRRSPSAGKMEKGKRGTGPNFIM